MWESIWSKMFKNEVWHRMVTGLGLEPGLAGYDLYLVEKSERQTDKIIVLLFPGIRQAPAGLREALLMSLHSHVEKKEDELFFPAWKLTLNISSLRNGERIVISRPHILFSLEGSLKGSFETASLLYNDHSMLRAVCGGSVGGLCPPRTTPHTTGEVKDVCSIMLHGKGGMVRYHRFQRPGCPRVRELGATHEGIAIGPWRFERHPQLGIAPSEI
jgi:hypothetical protein